MCESTLYLPPDCGAMACCGHTVECEQHGDHEIHVGISKGTIYEGPRPIEVEATITWRNG